MFYTHVLHAEAGPHDTGRKGMSQCVTCRGGPHDTGEMNVSVCYMQRWELYNMREKVHVTNSSGA